MKTTFFAAALLAISTLGATAQTKGHFEVKDFGSFKLHTYYTGDVMGDASYIVEGKKGLVTLEEPLFKDNVAEFGEYLEKLGKPVTERIADYHLGGTADEPIVLAEGFTEFSRGPVYGGMMGGFAQAFGDAIVAMPTGKTSEVKFGKTVKFAGVKFKFENGATSDFPAASIIIGGKVYYTHWTPARAHVSHLQVSSPAAVDAEIAEAKEALASGAELFIGGHGGAAGRDAVEFKIEYLNKVKALLAANNNADAFAAALKAAFPGLPGEEGVSELAKALYKK